MIGRSREAGTVPSRTILRPRSPSRFTTKCSGRVPAVRTRHSGPLAAPPRLAVHVDRQHLHDQPGVLRQVGVDADGKVADLERVVSHAVALRLSGKLHLLPACGLAR